MNVETRLSAALDAAGLGNLSASQRPVWLGHAVTRLSLGLTRERALAGRPYLNDSDLRAAYIAMFWPVSYLQTREVFRVLASDPSRAVKLGAVLDIGGGTGASTAAALDAGATSVRIVDHAKDALEYCQTLFKAEPVTTSEDDAEVFADNQRYDTILAVHVLNELFADSNRDELLNQTLTRWFDHLTPEGRVVIVEPALRHLGRDLLRLRDTLVDAGYTIEAPCIFQGHCPALADDDWCHTSLQWVPPPWVTRLSEETGLDRTRIKMSYLVVSKVSAPAPDCEGTMARIVSEPLHTKGRLRYIICGQSGRFPIVMPQSRVTDATKPMERLPPGTVIEFGPTQVKGDGQDVTKGFVRVLRP